MSSDADKHPIGEAITNIEKEDDMPNTYFKSACIYEAEEPDQLDRILRMHAEMLSMRRAIMPMLFHALWQTSRASVLCHQSAEILEFGAVLLGEKNGTEVEKALDSGHCSGGTEIGGK